MEIERALREFLARPETHEGLGFAALAAARIAPLVGIAPFFGLRAASATIRAGVLVALTVAFFPIAWASVHASASAVTVGASASEGGPFVLALLRETLIGSIFALVASVPFFALESGGRLVDLYRGANLADVIAPPTGERTSPYGDLAMLAGLALFASLGGVRLAIGAFGEGLVALPVGAVPHAAMRDVALDAARTLGHALAFAVAVAMPAGVAIVLAEVALGLVARTVPRISVFFLGMPLRATLGLVLGLASIGLVLERAVDASEASIAVARRALH